MDWRHWYWHSTYGRTLLIRAALIRRALIPCVTNAWCPAALIHACYSWHTLCAYQPVFIPTCSLLLSWLGLGLLQTVLIACAACRLPLQAQHKVTDAITSIDGELCYNIGLAAPLDTAEAEKMAW